MSGIYPGGSFVLRFAGDGWTDVIFGDLLYVRASHRYFTQLDVLVVFISLQPN